MLRCLSNVCRLQTDSQDCFKEANKNNPQRTSHSNSGKLDPVHQFITQPPTCRLRVFVRFSILLCSHEWLIYFSNYMDSLHSLFHYNVSSIEDRQAVCMQPGKICPDTSCAIIFGEFTDCSTHNLVPLAGCTQTGLAAVSLAAQEARDKSRTTHSAGVTYYHNALNLPKAAGKYGGFTW